MDGATRVIGVAIALAFPLLSSFADSPRDPMTVSDHSRSDASIHAVFFLNSKLGWAVGDRGVIWRTTNGGKNWERQTVQTNASLRSVSFVDPNHGWAVGGTYQAFSQHSKGVVLRTKDGGQTWNAVQGEDLPFLRHVQFFTPRQGIAVGSSSGMHSSGVFQTDDGGRSWTAWNGKEGANFVGAFFRVPDEGALVNGDGETFRVAGTEIRPTRGVSPTLRRSRGMSFSRDVGWVFGDGGLLFRTDDFGLTWNAPGALSEQIEQIDFLASSAVQGEVWLAGAPGTKVVHSSDGGKTWQVFSTGHTAPIRALHFIDPEHGWAAGDFGAILTTEDGGKTWKKQRGGGERASLLVFATDPQRIPLEAIGKYAGAEGYLTALEFLPSARSDLDSTLFEERLKQAVVELGGAAAQVAWKFPCPPEGLVWNENAFLSNWTDEGPEGAQRRLEEHMARTIRIWRPDVIVVDEVDPKAPDSLAKIVRKACVAASTRSSDPLAYTDQTIVGLQPWKVSRVFGSLPRVSSASVTIRGTDIAVRLGASLAEIADPPRALIQPLHTIGADVWGFELIAASGDDRPKKDLFAGLAISAGSASRRMLSESAYASVTEVGRQTQRRELLQKLFGKMREDPSRGAQWLAQAQKATRELPRYTAGTVLFQLSERYRESGQTDLAIETLLGLVEQYPDHPLAEPALVWAIQHYASAEVGWVERRKTHASNLLVASKEEADEDGKFATIFVEDERKPRKAPVATASFASTAGPESDPVFRADKALELSKQLDRIRVGWSSEPEIRFPLIAAYRSKGSKAIGDRLLESLANGPRNSPWTACAQAELWLARRGGTPQRPLLRCRSTTSRPRLDGVLDDAAWATAATAPLHGLSQESPSSLQVTYDAEFLYLGGTFPKVAGVDYANLPGARQRDAGLTESERVEIYLDLDRDYATYFHFAINPSGWIDDDCDGAKQWNPEWYVATNVSEAEWSVELAIPWTELGPVVPKPKDAWVFQAQRLVPKVGFESWSGPAAPKPLPYGFGLLEFE